MRAAYHHGVSHLVSRTSGLQISVLARRPAGRRSAVQRQAAVLAEGGAPRASRRLLPSPDEGMELPLGWLDSDRHARWEYPHSSQSSSGGSADDGPGPSLRATFMLPPPFEAMTLLLAWPEIGFPETLIELAPPGFGTVQHASVSISDAEPPDSLTPSWARQVTADPDSSPPIAEETGTAIAPQTQADLLRLNMAIPPTTDNPVGPHTKWRSFLGRFLAVVATLR